MKTLDKTRKAEQIKEAHAHLDIVEAELKHIFKEVKKLNKKFINVLTQIDKNK